MTYCLATTVAEQMFRGTNFNLTVQVLDDDGNPETLTTETVLLRLSESWTYGNTFLEIEGTIVDASEGVINFTFVPDHTKDLMTGAYDLTILVGGDVAFSGRFGILGKDMEVGE